MKTEKINNSIRLRRASMLMALVLVIITVSSQLRADSGICSGAQVNLPFTDVQATAFSAR
jgi:hypothetical protein